MKFILCLGLQDGSIMFIEHLPAEAFNSILFAS